MSALDDLRAAVSKNTTVVESTLTLLGGLADRMNAANTNNDPAVAALAAEVSAEADKLAAAVASNTPAVVVGEAEPAPVEAPPSDPTLDTPPA